jgi:hypothetical protein
LDSWGFYIEGAWDCGGVWSGDCFWVDIEWICGGGETEGPGAVEDLEVTGWVFWVEGGICGEGKGEEGEEE